MVQTVQIYRSPTNVTPGGLLPGVLSAELGLQTRLWIGSASGNRLLMSTDPADQISLPYLPLSGGTLTGPLVLAADPTTNLQASTKQYVDNKAFLPLSGGTLTGPLTLASGPSSAMHAATKQYVDTFSAYAEGAYVAKSGSTMTGALFLSADPLFPLAAATKQYVDAQIAAVPLANYLPLAGGTLTNALRMGSGIPAANSDRAYASTLFTGEIVVDPSGSTGGHIAFNTYLASGPVWKFRSTGFGVQQWMHSDGSWRVNLQASGTAGAAVGANTGQLILDQTGKLTNSGKLQASSSIIAYAASGNATVTCWSQSAGYAYGMWCGANALNFGNTDSAGVPTASRMVLDGNSTLLVGGAVYVGTAAVGNISYLSADSAQGTWTFQAGYGLVWRRSDGYLYYSSAGAAGSVAFGCTATGNFTAQGSIQGVNLIALAACYPSYSQSTDFYLNADGTNAYLRYAGGWSLFFTRANGSLTYQRAGANWFLWRAGDAVTYNAVANVGGIGPYADYSDARSKESIEDHDAGLETILGLQARSFVRLSPSELEPDASIELKAPPIVRKREVGFVAQEVQAVLPEAVMPLIDIESDDPGLAIVTTPIIACMVNAIKELAARVAALEH